MEGKLTQDDLREFSIEYYHQLAAFPRYLRQFARRLPYGVLRNSVYESLCDLQGFDGKRSRPHDNIWAEFAEQMGTHLDELRNRKPLPKTEQLIAVFLELAQAGSEAEAVAVFYTYQSQLPRLKANMAIALRSKYGANEPVCDCFVMSSTCDVRHAENWREQLENILDCDPPAGIHALVAAELAARALWRALDGVNARRSQLAQ
jgi:pyrroloquinoline-quinone synthase